MEEEEDGMLTSEQDQSQDDVIIQVHFEGRCESFGKLTIDTPPISPKTKEEYCITPYDDECVSSDRRNITSNIVINSPMRRTIDTDSMLEERHDLRSPYQKKPPRVGPSLEIVRPESIHDGSRNKRKTKKTVLVSEPVEKKKKKRVRFAPDVKINYTGTYYHRFKARAFYQFDMLEKKVCFQCLVHILIITLVFVGLLTLLTQWEGSCFIPTEIPVMINMFYLLTCWIAFVFHLSFQCCCNSVNARRVHISRERMARKVKDLEKMCDDAFDVKEGGVSSPRRSSSFSSLDIELEEEDDDDNEEEEEEGGEIIRDLGFSTTGSTSTFEQSDTYSAGGNLEIPEDETDKISDDKTRGFEEEIEPKKKKKKKKKKKRKKKKKKKKNASIVSSEEEGTKMERKWKKKIRRDSMNTTSSMKSTLKSLRGTKILASSGKDYSTENRYSKKTPSPSKLRNEMLTRIDFHYGKDGRLEREPFLDESRQTTRGEKKRKMFFRDTVKQIRKGEVEFDQLREEDHPYNWEGIGMVFRKLPHPYYSSWAACNITFCLCWCILGLLPHLSPFLAFSSVECSAKNPVMLLLSLFYYSLVILSQMIQLCWCGLSVR